MDNSVVEVAEDLEEFVKTIAATEPMQKVYYNPGVVKYEFQFRSSQINNGKVVVASKKDIVLVLDNEIYHSTDFFDARRNLIMMT